LHVALACLGVNRGDPRAREHLEHGLSLVAGLSAMPFLEIQARTLLGRVALAVGELGLAASLLEQARRELARFPDAGVLSRLLAREEHELEAVRGGGSVLPDSLTNAERRVLDLLPTHLSVSAIAEELHISANTVKSHEKAIFRKLGVARRADAVAAARRLGILDAQA
jgi:LuxR family maltose regulon positive regulatory protein